MTKPYLLCGVDEAGRGPWAGPVSAAAVILHPDRPIAGLNDSKKLTEKKRLALEIEVKEKAFAWGIGWASPEEIDQLNIRQATHLAWRRAIEAMGVAPDHIQIDGNDCPKDLPCTAEAIIKGDGKVAEISAASILAKTARDRLMAELCKTHPGYGFSKHKGYGVKAHMEALATLGPCPVHRMSFKPVALAAKRVA
ncbi:MAG: ribonuclease HII [Ponticaulis sp.]|nr:ribonuclease HII [Ponticaulis sp.]|tara:strand:- start:51239 stop:51823 length:585 start_codon:yes stop_codon:yes gene_type:complete